VSPSQGLSRLFDFTSKHNIQDEFLKISPRTTIQSLKDYKEVIIPIIFLSTSLVFMYDL